jgi:2-polyprenyl-3-methyl-5-hydroxy-6-metoxy-1,4-benzoquinol methylase
MSEQQPLKVLVTLVSYGLSHEIYLHRLIQEYRSMSFRVDIVVCSNVEREVPVGVELVVGMPEKNPWSLPFAHKKILAERVDAYDLFIYSEDDTLIREEGMRAFLRALPAMHDDEIPGYIRYEEQRDGTIRYCDANGHYHWDSASVVRRGDDTFAFFTNEHAAFYLLTQAQLRKAIASGGFLVPPHDGKYDLACSAATDPYTQCGFRKLVSISHLDQFLLHHLPNKYIGTRFGTHESLMKRQVNTLLQCKEEGRIQAALIPVETRLFASWYSKDYYEPMRPEVVGEVPAESQQILSIGCGSGEAERWLAQRGAQVTAACLDGVIASCAQSEGVEALWGSWGEIKNQIGERRFDCLLLSNVLHLAPDPSAMLAECAELLSHDGRCVILVPNLGSIRSRMGKWRRDKRYLAIGDYTVSGTRQIGRGMLARWMKAAGLQVEKSHCLFADRQAKLSRMTLHAGDDLLASEFLVVGRKTIHGGNRRVYAV